MRLGIILALVALAIIGLSSFSTPGSAQVPACIVDGTPVPCPTATPVPPTATPVPATPTPIVVTNTVIYRCVGPYEALAPYAVANWQVPLGINVYPYGGVGNWSVPTLIVMTNGVVTQAFPNARECLPVQTVTPPTPAPTATTAPAPAPQVIFVQPQQVEQPRTQTASSVAPSTVIRPPSTGDGGLAGNPHCNGNSDNAHLPNQHTSQNFPSC